METIAEIMVAIMNANMHMEDGVNTHVGKLQHMPEEIVGPVLLCRASYRGRYECILESSVDRHCSLNL